MAKYSIQLLTATTAKWNESNYVIPEGELVAEIKEDGLVQLKIGNGLDKFSDLPYTASKGQKGDPGTGLTIKGTYASESALKSAVKSPSAGDAYNVGSAAPYNVYIYDGVNATWKNCGKITGTDGKDGYTPQKGVDYFDGTNGTDGKTPVRGTDYWTEADKNEIKQYVEAAILNGTW